MAARAALSSSFPRLVSPSLLPAKLIPQRGLSAGGDHHGYAKVNLLDDPLSPSKWKEEHLVLACLSGWGIVLYGAYKFFAGGQKKEVSSPSPQ